MRIWLTALALCTLTNAGRAAARSVPDGWSCRNTELEITCQEGVCAVSDSHTPMDITLTATEMTVCAYSGCWSDAPSDVHISGRFVTYTGTALKWSSAPDRAADIAVTVDTADSVATILVAGTFAHPAICEGH